MDNLPQKIKDILETIPCPNEECNKIMESNGVQSIATKKKKGKDVVYLYYLCPHCDQDSTVEIKNMDIDDLVKDAVADSPKKQKAKKRVSLSKITLNEMNEAKLFLEDIKNGKEEILIEMGIVDREVYTFKLIK